MIYYVAAVCEATLLRMAQSEGQGHGLNKSEIGNVNKLWKSNGSAISETYYWAKAIKA